MRKLFFVIVWLCLALVSAQVFDYPIKAPSEIFEACDSPTDAFATGYCVIDGDTVRVLMDLGEGEYRFRLLRLDGINTAETRTSNAREKDIGLRTKALLIDYLAQLEPSDLIIVSNEKAKFYGRVIGDIHKASDPSFSLANWLIENQLGLPYNGEARAGFTDADLDLIEGALEKLEY